MTPLRQYVPAVDTAVGEDDEAGDDAFWQDAVVVLKAEGVACEVSVFWFVFGEEAGEEELIGLVRKWEAELKFLNK